jgi:hypothetical protein
LFKKLNKILPQDVFATKIAHGKTRDNIQIPRFQFYGSVEIRNLPLTFIDVVNSIVRA